MFLKLLLSSSLTIIVAAAFLTDDPIIKISQEKLNIYPNYILQQYDIIITHIEKNILFSNCSISIKILSPISSIILYSPVKYIGITVFYYPQNHSINSSEKMIPFIPAKSLYNNETNSVEYIFTNDLLPGNYVIKLVTNITEDTGLRNFYKRGERQWLATYVDTIGIQHMIPRLAETFHISPVYNIIIKRHQNYTVLSNIPRQTVEMNNKNMTMTHFNTFVRPNYFVFVDNRANLSLIPGPSESKIRVDMWCGMHCAFSHKIVQNITLYLFDKWERLNKTWQINHIAIPDFPENESIINLGLVIYREADVTYIENVDSVASKIKVAHFMAYKVVQECLYYENPFWSLSSSLNEAIVAFLELYITDKVLPNNRVLDLFVVQFEQESYHLDTEYNTSLYNTSLNSAFKNPLYIKGSRVFRSFQQMVSEQIFWECIRKYVRDNKPVDYFAEMENPSTQKSANNSYLIWMIIKAWTVILSQKYYPVLKITREYNSTVEWIHASTHNLNNLKKLGNYYNVPITCTNQTHIGNSYIISLNDFLQDGLEHMIKEDGWILLNIKQTGYFRVNYDIENWRRIASYLNSENYMKIHVLNRAQIIDDAFHLMITNQLNSTVFWSITKYLSRETDYVAWYPMFKALEYLSNIFLFSETNFENIKTEMSNLLHDLLDKLGYNEVSNEHDLTKSLRVEAAKWTCNLGGRICIAKAQHNLNRHLADPEKNTLLPWWKEWTYCQGLKVLYYFLSNEDSPWWGVYRLGKEKFKPKFLKYLSCPEDSQFIKDYLNLIKNDSITSIMFLKDFSDKDYINYFLFTIAKHAKNSAVLNFILHNLENIKPKQVSKYATFAVIINHVYSTNQLGGINEFLTNKFIDVWRVEFNKYMEIRFSYMEGKEVKVKISELGRNVEEFKSMRQYILIIQSKIQTRIFEIKSQKDYFQNFIKYQ